MILQSKEEAGKWSSADRSQSRPHIFVQRLQYWRATRNKSQLRCQIQLDHQFPSGQEKTRLERRTTEDSSFRRIMRLKTYNPTNNECLPKFVQWDNTSSTIKTAILSYHRPRWTNRKTYLLRHANLLLIFRLSLILLITSHTGTVHIIWPI